MHLGIILDGNRRWATAKGLPKIIGHKYGLDNLIKIMELCPKYQVDVLTVYALSTENLQRGEKELKNLFGLITKFASNVDRFNKDNVKVNVLGNLDMLREDSAKALKNLVKQTAGNDKMIFQICVAYGGRDELVRAIKKLNKQEKEITEQNISLALDSGLEPDLIIRTGGHQRLSNFLPWQSTYSEFLFLKKTWPSFNEEDLAESVEKFKDEKRNFGA